MIVVKDFSIEKTDLDYYKNQLRTVISRLSDELSEIVDKYKNFSGIKIVITMGVDGIVSVEISHTLVKY